MATKLEVKGSKRRMPDGKRVKFDRGQAKTGDGRGLPLKTSTAQKEE